MHIVGYLESRIRVVSARSLEERPVPHYICFLVTHVQRQTFTRGLLTVHLQRKVIYVIMDAVEWICILRAEKILVL
jgi:hypothetical protein